MTSKSNTKKKPSRLLSHSRPGIPNGTRSSGTLSSRTTRTLIRSHHNLHKRLRQAEQSGNERLVASIKAEIEKQGGLAKYQEASIQGQTAQRGGDSSKVLIEWLKEIAPNLKQSTKDGKLRLLEVGALRVDNVCSTCGIFEVKRIDLNSQHKDILQQDFMERPLPSGEEDHKDFFDVISLSLVVNYVPNASDRGEMLRRVRSFLQTNNPTNEMQHAKIFPGLFLVLPSACVMNSRYMDDERLERIMESLGYTIVKKKLSSKLVYYYFYLDSSKAINNEKFGKMEVRAGASRNNFTIIL